MHVLYQAKVKTIEEQKKKKGGKIEEVDYKGLEHAGRPRQIVLAKS